MDETLEFKINDDYSGEIWLDDSCENLILDSGVNKETISLSDISFFEDKKSNCIILHQDNPHREIEIKANKLNEKSLLHFQIIRGKLQKLSLRENFRREKALKYIIKEPKDFQLEILNFAEKQNTAVLLETGKGKTYVAVLLLKSIFGEPINCNFIDKIKYDKKSNKKALFLCKTVSLCLQQARVLKYNTNLKIFKIYGGRDKESMPTYQKFNSNISKYDVIVGTPETVYKYFTIGYLSREKINIIIMDECHHCRENDFYNLILKHFIFISNEYQPQILGLTASPTDNIHSDEKSVYESIQNLSNTMNSFIYIPKIFLEKNNLQDDKEIIFTPYQNLDQKFSELKIKFFNTFLLPIAQEYFKSFNFYLRNEIPDEKSEFLYYFSLFSLVVSNNENSEKLNWIFDESDYVQLQNNSGNNYFGKFDKSFVENLFFTKVQKKFNFVEDFLQKKRILMKDDVLSSMTKIAKYSNLLFKFTNGECLINMFENFLKEFQTFIDIPTSFKSLLQILLSKIRENQELKHFSSDILIKLKSLIKSSVSESRNKVIVFSKYRIIVFYINKIINSDNTLPNSLQIMGFHSKNFLKFSESDLKQSLDEFRINSDKQILISTDIAEEGIDIQQCNTIIHLDPIQSIKSYIQKNGRARAGDSKIYLLHEEISTEVYKKNISSIFQGINIITKIVKEDKIKPNPVYERFIEGISYFQTKKNARVYLNYAKKILEEFISRLEFDGYNWMKEDFKIEKKLENNKMKYIPYLSLPSVLEGVNKIFDTSYSFETEAEAKKYSDKYKDNFYLKAIKTLHYTEYLDNYLSLNKNNDEFLFLESKVFDIPSEPTISIKTLQLKEENSFICHVYKIRPKLINLNIHSPYKKNKIYSGILSNFANSNNFDIYIRRSELKTLYSLNLLQSQELEDEHKEFHLKPKIPFEFYNQINIKFKSPFEIKIKTELADYVNFFHCYQMYLISDGECHFYYNIYKKRFKFSHLFETSMKRFENIFRYFDDSKLSEINEVFFENDKIKTLILKKVDKNNYQLDIDYYNFVISNVRKDIKFYSDFLTTLMIQKPKTQQEIKEISEEYVCENNIKNLNILSRNLLNFTKCFIYNYSEKTVKGSTSKCASYSSSVKYSNYHEYYLNKYGIITKKEKDYYRTKIVDFNARLFKYKINLKSLNKKVTFFDDKKVIKRFNFYPLEILFPLKYISIDQLYYFTLSPLIIYKIENNMKYFYYTKCLNDEYNIIKSDNVDLKLIIQALNSQTTSEIQNYERLEFLGDAVLKFLASWQVFNQFKHGNKDLLSHKRGIIVSNENLFEKGYLKSLYKYLITSQINFKNIKKKSEWRVYNVIENRNISKQIIKSQYIEENLKKESEISENQVEIVDPNYDEFENLEKDHFNYNYTIPEQELETISYDKDLFSLAEINSINLNIEINDPTEKRNLYKKHLADLVESLTGFVFVSNSSKMEDSLIESNKFLMCLGVLDSKFDLNHKKEEFWLKDLVNVNNFKIKTELKINHDYKFKNKELLFQSLTHPTLLTPESIELNRNVVNKSYQRLSFLGESLISLYVSNWVFRMNPSLSVNQSMLHKLKICGINYHMISLMSLDLGLDNNLMQWNKFLDKDLQNYKEKFRDLRKDWENDKKIKKDDFLNLDIEFMNTLCDVFYAYWGSILLDCRNVPHTLNLINNYIEPYLNENATIETYSEHPKVRIIDNFYLRRDVFRRLKENGFNRLKFNRRDKIEKKQFFYHYQLEIGSFVIYENDIVYNRADITKAQNEALKVFLIICEEVDKRIKLSMQKRYLDLEDILLYLKINYRKTK